MYRDSSAGPQPLTPGQVSRVTIALGDIHYTFSAGSRIEIDVTSSNFPRRACNTNSGHPVLANDGEADIRVATNSVHHGPATPSFVKLPVLGGLNATMVNPRNPHTDAAAAAAAARLV
jgi:hypothetical protein